MGLDTPYPELDELLAAIGVEANLQGLRAYRIVLWSKHGVMARSELSVSKAVDRIEYAETAALGERILL